MNDLINGLFNAFMPQDVPHHWNPEFPWLHISADTSIGLAFLVISVCVMIVAVRNSTTSIRSLLYLLAGLLLVSGLTHFASIATYWGSMQVVLGGLKLLSALLSLLAAVALLYALPNLLARKSTETLQQAHDALAAEMIERERIEREHIKSESRFKNYAEIAAEWFWELDDALRFTFVSDRLEAYTGLPSQSLIGRTVSEIQSNYPANTFARADQINALNEKQAFDGFEFPWEIDGEIRRLSISGRPLFDDNNRFLGFRGIGRDVTAERRALQAARESEDKLRLLVNSLPVGIAYIDKELHYQLSNETYRTWFGMSPESLNGQHIKSVLGAELFDEAQLAIDCALQGETVMYEGSLASISGIHREVQTTFEPHVSNKQEVLGLFVLSHDISNEKRRVTRLTQSLQHLGAALDGLDAALVVLDTNGVIRTANSAWETLRQELTDVSTAEQQVYRDVCTQLLLESPPETLAAVQAVDAHARGEGSAVRAEVRCPTPERDRWFAITTSQFVDKNSQYVLVAHDDITERIRLARELRERDNTLAQTARLNSVGELAGTIAHELNQPLTAISNYASIALSMVQQADPVDEMLLTALEKLVHESRRSGAIVHRVNNFVRQRPTEHVNTDLASVIREVFSWMADRAKAEQIELSIEISGPLPRAWVDETQLEQVLYNLLGNAIEAIANERTPHGKVAIHAATADDKETVLVRVCDNGPGLSDEMAASIFDPFKTSKPTGLGLGLAISRSIVENHGGRLWYEKSQQGGSDFCFTLPISRKTTE